MSTQQRTAETVTAAMREPDSVLTVHLAQAVSHVREVAGLTPAQRLFLLERLRYATDGDCCDALRLHRDMPSHWRGSSLVFEEEYGALVAAGTTALAAQVQAELERMAGLIPSTIVAMLSAEDDVYDKAGHVVGRTPAWRARKDGLEVLTRWLDRWNGTPAISQDNESAAQLRRIADTLEAARQQSSRPTAAVQDSGQYTTIIEGTAEALPDGPGQ